MPSVVLLIIVIALSTVPAVQTWAQDWTDAANYPARVRSMTFPSGILDRNRALQRGSWTIRFGREDTTATFELTEGLNDVWIKGPYLVCSNAIVGDARCWFGALISNARQKRECSFTLVSRDLIRKAGFAGFSVDCPKSIAFER